MTSFEVLQDLVTKVKASESAMKEVSGMNKSFQFKPSDQPAYYVEFKSGEIVLEKGEKQGASATVSATDQVISDVLSGQLNAVSAFMSGKLKVSGDIMSAQKITTLASKIKR